MKNFIFVILVLLVSKLWGQDYLIDFSGNGASSHVDNIKIDNLTQNKSITISGSTILHLMGTVTGNSPLLEYIDYPLIVYPNPSSGDLTIQFDVKSPGEAVVIIFDISGREIIKHQLNVKNGTQLFKVKELNTGVYTVQILLENQKLSKKIVCHGKSKSKPSIVYEGISLGTRNVIRLKSTEEEKFWQYNTGDRLKFQGTTGKYSTIVMDVPTQSKTLSFNFIECTDADGNNYPIVQIGNQIWMAENLKTTKYNDGTSIPNVADNAIWSVLTSGAYCWYNNDIAYKSTYGALYNWYAINSQKLAPIGWRVPTNSEWTTLSNSLGGDNVSGGKLKETGLTHWQGQNNGATNESGFTAVPGGSRIPDSSFDAINVHCNLWSSTQYSETQGYYRNVGSWFSNIVTNAWIKTGGLSVRCLLSSSNLPTIATTIATGISQTSATSGGNVTSDGGATITARGVCWSTSQNPTTENSKTSDGTGSGSFTSSITGLTAGMTYYVRAYATNSTGTAYGTQVTFTTATTVTLPVITTTTASNITQTTASSGGNVTSDGGATVTARGVCWSTSQNPTTANNKTSDGTGAGSFTSSMTGLTAGTTYYVRAYAINSVGTTYGNEISFTTGQTINSPTVLTTSTTNITQTSASSGGNVTSDGGTTVTARGVCWSTTSNPTIANNKTNDGSGAGSFTNSMTGLTAGTTYYVRAYATNSAGTAYGNEVSFRTLALPTITTTAATSITQTAASSGGNVTSDGGATVTARGVCWSTASNPTIANSKTNDGSGTGSFTSNINGLTAGTTYYIRAYATNSVGTTYGNEIILRTLTLPTVVTTAASNIALTTATIGGNVTSDGGTPITARGICWSTSPNPTTANNKTNDGYGTGSFTGNLTGLSMSTKYYARAYAINNVGTSYGSELSFTSLPTDGLIAYYPFNGNANDQSGNGNHGTSYNVTLATDRAGNQNSAYSFNGTSSFIDVPSSTSLNIQDMSAVTICGWFFANTQASSAGFIVRYGTTGTGGGTGLEIFYSVNNDGRLYVQNWHANLQPIFSANTGVLQNSRWNFFAISYDFSANIEYLYLNGSLVGSYSQTLYKSTNPIINIGRNTNISSYFNGVIDDIRIYSKVLNSGEISALYQEMPLISLPNVTTSVVSNINQTSATSGGNVTSDGGATVTARGVCWSTTSNPTIANSKTNDGSGAGSFSSSMTGLTAGTTYYVRAYATNSVGTNYGNEILFTTSGWIANNTSWGYRTDANYSKLNDTPDISFKGVDGDLTTVLQNSWWVGTNPDVWYLEASFYYDLQNPVNLNAFRFYGVSDPIYGAVDYFQLYYSDNPSSGWSLALNQTMPSTYSLEWHIFTFPSISARYWKLTVKPKQKAFEIKEIGFGYNVPLPSLPTITTTAATSITQTAAISGGNVTSDGGVTVTARGVCWSTTSNPTIANSKTNDGSGTGSFTSSITGLTAGTTYYVRAYATNSAGTSYGNEVTFTTLSLPTVITTAATSVTQTSATSGGNVTADGGATVSARGVCWGTSTNPTIANSKTNDGTGTGSFTSSITGLTAGTTYYVRAYVTNSAGTNYGTQVSFTTASWMASQTSWLNTNLVNTITAPSNLLDNNLTTNGGLSMSDYSITYSKEMYLNFGTPKTISGFKFSYEFPNTYQGKCSSYPGPISYSCYGNLYYKNNIGQWVKAYTCPNLNTSSSTIGCPMTDSFSTEFSQIIAQEWKFEMIGNYWLGGAYQTTTYYRVIDVNFLGY